MKNPVSRILITLACVAALGTGNGLARDLSFEERVAAQEAIERVYYSHQMDATLPFEEAVPRTVLEGKVRKYLEQTVALEDYWNTQVTDEMLRRELERMGRGTRLPGRLRELFAALNGDPFLIKECLARATLVDRLARNFYAFDPALHADARQRAEDLHRRLAGGTLDPWSDHPDRSVFDLVQRESGADGLKGRHQESGLPEPTRGDDIPDGNGPARRLLSPDEFREERARFPETPGRVSPVSEEREAFVIRVLLSDAPRRARVASYVIPKTAWDLWWETAEEHLQGEEVAAVASEGGPLPVVASRPAGASGAAGEPAGMVPDAPGREGSPGVVEYAWDNGILDAVQDRRSVHTAVWTGSLMVAWGGASDGRFLSTGVRYDPATDTSAPTSTVGAPAARGYHAAVWTGSLMVAWGGHDANFHLSTGGRYDPATDAWTATAAVGAPSRRSMPAAVWTGSAMLVWGGYDSSYRLATGGRYDPATDTWTATSTLGAPSARTAHTAVWTGSEMVVWGGTDGTSLSTGGRYHPATNTWRSTSAAGAPAARGYHTAIWTGSLMVVWGGKGAGNSPLDTGGRYDPAADTWMPTLASGAPSARSDHTAVWTGAVMVVWGGYDGTALNTGGRYDPLTDSWTPTSTTGASPGRRYHTAIWTGTLMVVWGGTGDTPLPVGTGGRYDPATDSWMPARILEGPSARYYHTAVWTGSVMVVWGGYDGTSSLSTGGRYDPATDSWTPTSTMNAPSRRHFHTSVWTGSVMVVWGGYGGAYVNTGGRYDPAADAWTGMSATGAPSARGYHAAIWTGSRMVVWGGYTGGAFLDTGGRYDPAVDSWTPTSTAGAPSGRMRFTSIWSGSMMVVWGGFDGIAYLNSGGRYDPVTDAWTPTSVAGAPSASQDHSAVWAGNLMLTWGGFSGATINPGGRYDPAADSWTPISTLGAPPGRNRHTAVWTGNEMIVWGGQGIVDYLSSGGRYDPATDSWTPASTLGAPSGRIYHTAVWTGSEMIVWGGRDLSALATGGRYLLITNDPPVANAGPDQVLECTGSEGATAVLDGSGSADPDSTPGTNDDIVGFAWSEGSTPLATGEIASVLFSLGFHTVTLTVTDKEGEGDTDETRITVRDTTPPTIVCPPDLLVECQSAGQAEVVVPPAAASDSCHGAIPVANDRTPGGADASGSYPLGNTRITFTATDGAGNTSSCETLVTVVDTTPPLISATVTPGLLWPPNHRMVDVRASVAATDSCGGTTVVLTSVTSSELDDAAGGGDGNTTDDIRGAQIGTADYDFQLRAERAGAGDGRVYRVAYTAADGSGNQAGGSSIVLVPHDQGGGTEPVRISADGDTAGTALQWDPVAGASLYRVIRGTVGSLREAGDFIDLGTVSCVQPDSPATSTRGREDAEDPPPGGAFFYLAAYHDGRDSGYGTDTAAKPRVRTGGGCE